MNKYISQTDQNIFVNSQIRSIAGTGYLQEQEIFTLGEAISTLLADEFEESCNIIIATDTRTSSTWIKDTLIKGLATNDINIYDAGICPTPFVAKALKDFKPTIDENNELIDTPEIDTDQEHDSFFTLGIVITASHNPAEYNGIKILTEFGYLTQELEMEISEIFHDLMQVPENIPLKKPDCIDIDLVSFYETAILQQLQNIPINNISTVLDCSYGATALIAPQIFQAAGIKTIAIHNERNGSKINQNSGCLNPQLLLDAIHKHNTTWGCAFDGDGDRVIIAHKSGKIFDGDDLLVFLSLNQEYKDNKIIVGTFMTNQGIVDFTQQHQKNLIRTQVGERNVIQALTHHQAMIGSETCGHITIMDHAFCSDGIFAALLFFDTITSDPEILNVSYTKYPQIHTSLPLKNKKIDNKKIGLIVSQYQNAMTRIVIRESNTEPVLRIMVEHPDEQKAKEILETLKNLFINEML